MGQEAFFFIETKRVGRQAEFFRRRLEFAGKIRDIGIYNQIQSIFAQSNQCRPGSHPWKFCNFGQHRIYFRDQIRAICNIYYIFCSAFKESKFTFAKAKIRTPAQSDIGPKNTI